MTVERVGLILATLIVVLAGCMGPARDTRHPADHSPATSSSPAASSWDAQPPTQPASSHTTATTRTTTAPTTATTSTSAPPVVQGVPHVVVGVPDTGINPYHKTFYRPQATKHPCTYIPTMPCSLVELPLTVGGDDYNAALHKDAAVWDSVRPGVWYWIPRTNIVAAYCDEPQGGNPPEGLANEALRCILDDGSPHGTQTASSVLTENPDALLAIQEGTRLEAFASIPVDVLSLSWGNAAPLPIVSLVPALDWFDEEPMVVQSAGNDPSPSFADYQNGDPAVINVGGGYADTEAQEAFAGLAPDVVSYFCRPVALTQATTGYESNCGTSFATPTVAGALSKVILKLRQRASYAGSLADGDVAPGVSIADVRQAMNVTASYEPDAEYVDEGVVEVPLNPVAPWFQWGWGFYDGTIAEATYQFLRGNDSFAAKPDEAYLYMETVWTLRNGLYG